MTLGEASLGFAVGAALVAIAVPRLREPASRVHAALVLASLAWMVADLLLGTLQHRYAWAHTRTDYPWPYRLAGLWGGEEGTVLLWAAVVSFALLFVHERLPRQLLLGLSAALATLALRFGVFRPTDVADLAAAPLGRGLSDVLVTPLMVIHPPVQFIAYGLIAVPAAYALASLWEPAGDGAWAGRAFPWARRAWLFATLGLGLGALWAYYVLSFGGYWAWDPVETSNLLPWLALTAFLHAGKQRMRGQGHETSSLLLAYGALVLVLFATFATRSGLWVSVHAFTDPTDRFEPDAPARLLAILDAHLPTRAFFGLFGALLLGGTGAFVLQRMRQPAWGGALLALAGAALLAPRDAWGAFFHLASLATPVALGAGVLSALLVGLPFAVHFARADAPQAKLDLSPRTLLAAASVLLSVALGVVLLLQLQVVNGPQRAIFDQRAPFVAAPIVSAITLMLALAPLGRRGAVALAGGALAAGLVAAALVPGARVFALAVPLCGGAALAAVLKLVHVQGASAPRRVRIAGALLMLASLLALVMWSNPPTFVLGAQVPESVSLVLGVGGVALGVAAFVGAVAALRGRGFGIALGGAAAGVLGVGYGPGALLALASLALLVPARAAFAPGRPEAVRVREAGIYLVHLAVVLGLLGVAASTYAQEREVLVGVAPGASVEVGDLSVTLGEAQVAAPAGRIASVDVALALAKDGRALGAEALRFEWRAATGVYAGHLDVRRALAEDVYVRPMAFHTPGGWVGADSAAGAQVAAADVDAVSFSLSVLPLMSLVWAATWMMVVGMGLILIAGVR